jgi:hypothetical protein
MMPVATTAIITGNAIAEKCFRVWMPDRSASSRDRFPVAANRIVRKAGSPPNQTLARTICSA